MYHVVAFRAATGPRPPGISFVNWFENITKYLVGYTYDENAFCSASLHGGYNLNFYFVLLNVEDGIRRKVFGTLFHSQRMPVLFLQGFSYPWFDICLNLDGTLLKI